jgi:hypothetical protein
MTDPYEAFLSLLSGLAGDDDRAFVPALIDDGTMADVESYLVQRGRYLRDADNGAVLEEWAAAFRERFPVDSIPFDRGRAALRLADATAELTLRRLAPPIDQVVCEYDIVVERSISTLEQAASDQTSALRAELRAKLDGLRMRARASKRH